MCTLTHKLLSFPNAIVSFVFVISAFLLTFRKTQMWCPTETVYFFWNACCFGLSLRNEMLLPTWRIAARSDSFQWALGDASIPIWMTPDLRLWLHPSSCISDIWHTLRAAIACRQMACANKPGGHRLHWQFYKLNRTLYVAVKTPRKRF